MKTLIPLLALIASFAIPAAARDQDAIDDAVRAAFRGEGHTETILSGGDSVRIPFSRHGNLILVEMRVDGSEPIPLIVDTGAPIMGVILFEGPRTETLGLDLAASVSLGTSADVDAPNTALNLTVEAPGLKLDGLLGIVTPPPSPELDECGVIGASLFKRFVVEIDQDAEEIALTRPAAFAYEGDGATLPFRITLAGKIRIDCEVGQGDRAVTAPFVIDSGAWFGLRFDSSRPLDLPEPARSLTGVTGRTLYGTSRGLICRTDRLRIGGHTLTDVLTTREVGESAFPEDSNMIGGAVLSDFNITYDYSRFRLHLEPGKTFGRRRQYDMTGLDSTYTEDDAWLVNGIHPDSPAEAAGLRAGDRVTAIDGRGLADYTTRERKALVRRAGATITLTVDRNGETLHFDLKLRPLI